LTRRLAGCAALAALLPLVALAPVPSRAQDTDVSGRVEGSMELSLRRVAPGRVEATVTTTLPGTALRVSQRGRSTRSARTFADPVTNAVVTVRTSPSRTAVTRQTITLGPQSP
jgi:hypothetical protein